MNPQIKIVRIKDLFDSRLTEFRRQVCIENGADENYLDRWLNYRETRNYFENLERQADFEEIWKFGNTKWKDTQFTNIEAIASEDESQIFGVSGCRKYTGGLLRVSMHLYVLRDARKFCRNLQFSENGLFSRHLDFARTQPDVDALFMTVFPHNSKLQYHVKNLASRRLSSDGSKMHFIHDLIAVPEPLLFNEVKQHFFYYPLKDSFQWRNEVPVPVST